MPKKAGLLVCCALALSACTNQPGTVAGNSGHSSVLNTGTLLGGLGGAGIGAIFGGKNKAVASLVGAGAGSILGTLINNLTQQQQQEREQALQQAAAMPQGGTTSWQAPASAAQAGGSQ